MDLSLHGRPRVAPAPRAIYQAAPAIYHGARRGLRRDSHVASPGAPSYWLLGNVAKFSSQDVRVHSYVSAGWSVDGSFDRKTSTVECDFSVRPILQSSFLRRPTAAMGASSRPEPGGSVTPEVDGASPRQQSGDRATGWREGGDKGGQPDRPQRVRVPHAASLCKEPKASCAATTGATPRRATPLISMTLGGRASSKAVDACVAEGSSPPPEPFDLRRRTRAAVDSCRAWASVAAAGMRTACRRCRLLFQLLCTQVQRPVHSGSNNTLRSARGSWRAGLSPPPRLCPCGARWCAKSNRHLARTCGRRPTRA